MYAHTDILGQPIRIGDRIVSINNSALVPSTVYGLTKCYVKHSIDRKSLPNKCIVINHIETLKDINISKAELINAVAKTYPEKLI